MYNFYVCLPFSIQFNSKIHLFPYSIGFTHWHRCVSIKTNESMWCIFDCLSRLDHYSSIHDIQTLAMLCCTFGSISRRSNQLMNGVDKNIKSFKSVSLPQKSPKFSHFLFVPIKTVVAVILSRIWGIAWSIYIWFAVTPCVYLLAR